MRSLEFIRKEMSLNKSIPENETVIPLIPITTIILKSNS